MAQTFGMGRYVPPDQEGTISANQAQKKRAPGNLRKDGTQTVRFEMPFAVWCHTCNPYAIIGQGVRFNAEKKKVGKYHTTPVWSFRMRHPACGGTIEIRTDPKNTAYVVTEGGKSRDYGDSEDRLREGENGMPILTADERQKRREDVFAALEGKAEEKALVKDNTRRIEELQSASERDWNDPWLANRRMRDTFRRERKVQQREAKAVDDLQSRIGTGMDIVPGTAEDAVHAKLISYGATSASSSLGQANSHPVFRTPARQLQISRSSQAIKVDQKDVLRRRLFSNTRASLNPFG